MHPSLALLKVSEIKTTRLGSNSSRTFDFIKLLAS